jgi:hyperosmotically inducible periplasmic protein
MQLNRMLIAAVAAAASLTSLPGCAVSREQSTVGEYIDDATITAKVKAKFVEDKSVDASAISVETLGGEVILSGFAKSSAEKARAQELAQQVKGVRSVKNSLEVRG